MKGSHTIKAVRKTSAVSWKHSWECNDARESTELRVCRNDEYDILSVEVFASESYRNDKGNLVAREVLTLIPREQALELRDALNKIFDGV